MTHLALTLALLAAARSSQPPSIADAFQQISSQAEQARLGGRLNEAANLYSNALKLRPEWVEGWWYEGTLLYEQDRIQEARIAFERVVALDPKPGPALALLALCEYPAREYDRALEHLRRWEAEGALGTPDLAVVARFHWALLLTRAGLFEQAVYLLDAELRAGKKGSAMTEAAGLAALRMPMLPGEYPPEQRDLVHLAGQAASAILERRVPDAQDAFRELLRRYPDTPNVHYLYGTFLLTPDPQTAIEEFRRELQVSPGHVPAMLQIANEYLARGEASDALPFAERAASLEPDHFATRAMLGKAYLRLDRTQDALRELEIARKLAPENPQIRFSLSKAYAGAGRLQEADAELASFRQLKERDEKVREHLAGAR